MSLTSEILADSPVAYYKLDDGTSTTATDASGNGLDGTWNSAPSSTSGPSPSTGTAITAPASGRCALPNSGTINSFTSAVTLEAWFKTSDTTAIKTIMGCDDGTSKRWQLRINGQTAEFYLSLGGTYQHATASGSWSDGNWHHIVGTYDGGGIRIYVDTRYRALTTTSGSISTVSIQGAIGNMSSGGAAQPWIGSLDECVIYSSVLSTARMRDHYVIASGALPAIGATSREILADSPKGYWKLDEPAGSPNPTMIDFAGNGNSGLYVGSYTPGVQTPRGRAVTFDGSSAYGDVPQNGDLWTDTNWTLECWFYITALPATDVPKPLVGLSYSGSGTLDFSMGFNINGGGTGNTNKLQGGLFNSGWKVGTIATSPSINTWHHFVTVWDQSVPGSLLYLDGVLAGGSGATGSGVANPATSPDILIARRWDTGSADRYFAGTVQHVAYYQAKLTAARILAHYNAGIQSEPKRTVQAALARASTR